MNPGHIIFVFVLLYSTLFAINTNSLEKKMLYTVLQDIDWWTITHHSVQHNPGVSNYLKVPFYFDKNKLTKVSSGQLYNAYCFTKPYAKVQEQLQSKVFWNEYLPKHGISVPKLNATTNPYKEYEDIDPDRDYISKPEFGTSGNGIEIIKGRDVKPTEKNRLIQDKIGSCGYDGARSYRVVTTYDGDVLARYEFKNNETITSNVSGKGKVTVNEHDTIPEIEDVIHKLCKLHKRDFNFCFSIGWDLMVDCEDKDPSFPDIYVLEGNWPSGLYGDTTNRNDQFIEMVNKKARTFYKIKGL